MSLAKLKELFNHERYQSIAILVIAAFFLWFYGCESKVRSLANPQLQVTRTSLEAEVDFYLAQAEIRFRDLDRMDEFKRVLVEKTLLIAEGGTVNPYGIIATIIGILGIGATVDNVRKRVEIKTVKAGNANSTKTTRTPDNA